MLGNSVHLTPPFPKLMWETGKHLQSPFISLLSPRGLGAGWWAGSERRVELSQPPTQPRTIPGRGLMAESREEWSESSGSPTAALSASGDSVLRPSGRCCAELHPIWAKQISSLPVKGSGQLSRAAPCTVAGGCHYQSQIGHNYMIPGGSS